MLMSGSIDLRHSPDRPGRVGKQAAGRASVSFFLHMVSSLSHVSTFEYPYLPGLQRLDVQLGAAVRETPCKMFSSARRNRLRLPYSGGRLRTAVPSHSSALPGMPSVAVDAGL